MGAEVEGSSPVQCSSRRKKKSCGELGSRPGDYRLEDQSEIRERLGPSTKGWTNGSGGIHLILDRRTVNRPVNWTGNQKRSLELKSKIRERLGPSTKGWTNGSGGIQLIRNRRTVNRPVNGPVTKEASN